MFDSYTETAVSVGLEMVRVPAGRFTMGLSDREPHHSYEGPEHPVDVPAFFLGRYPVTQAQWRAVVKELPAFSRELGPGPSHFLGPPNASAIRESGAWQPVERVSWDDAVEFCARLSRATDREYRLPTEAEWEYACRAGTTGPHAGDLDAMAWYRDNSGMKPHPVGMKQPNAFGLFDLHGNVWEWCSDPWHDGYEGAPTNGTAWTGGDSTWRVVRGGYYASSAEGCRSGHRFRSYQDEANCSVGFRVAAAV